MIKRPGQAIQTIALVFLVIECLGFGLSGLILLFNEPLIGLLCFAGIAVAFISYVFLYSFGRLVDNSDEIVLLLKNGSGNGNKNIIAEPAAVNKGSTVESDELPDL